MDLSVLNTEQRLAVECIEGPLLVLAGAGSGKTRVLTYRIANLVENHGVMPWNILALTFTNKAAREMRERIAALIDYNVEDMWVMTFHSFCARLLRIEADHIGYDRRFVIYDDSDQLSVYNDIIKKLSLDGDKFTKRSLKERISQAKNQTLNVEAYLGEDAFADVYLKVYKMYQKQLKQNNAMDFDDLLLKTIELFTTYPEVLNKYRQKFKYLLVDEYQDTNMAQYKLVQLLGEEHQNICVVGDDDQSIYGWRGADIRNILGFEKDFHGAKLIRLEQNYRSTSMILDAANHVIDHNMGRKSKNLWTERQGGEKINYYFAMNERIEAEYVCKSILERIRDGRQYSDFAVLYRTNAQSRMLETTLASYGIPYRVYGGQKFYERAEIKDVMAYLRLLYNPADDVAFQRIINVPRRGIGAAAIGELLMSAEQEGLPMYLVATDGIGLSQRVRPKMQAFTEQMTELLAIRETMPLHEFVNEVLERVHYETYLRDDKKENYETRMQNIQELLGAMREFEAGLEEDVDVLGAYLENVALVSDIDNLEDKSGQVALMTLHSAKGLEFPVVFITGMEENIFPSSRSAYDPEKLEEERRLCYVGITRAMESLHLIRTRQRSLYGEMAVNKPSRFLSEIPQELIEDLTPEQEPVVASSTQKKTLPAFTHNVATHGGFGVNTTVKAAAPSPRVNAPDKEYCANQRVRHAKFGAGTIMAVEGKGSAQVISIDFGGTVKKFAAAFAPIETEE
ncbi:DNA helicase PcrA [Christensenellaceae bacterium OttesenSCG-928-M15]|nr:DNA helicase PcrA [Christensenellaceae bacterium OttesenSCG-928-M15]